MPPDIPEYYRHLADQSDEGQKRSDTEHSERGQRRGMPIPESATRRQEPEAAQALQAPPLENHYNANSFTLSLPEDWVDRTVFTLTGPVTDGIQHNITISRQPELPVDDLVAFAELQVQSLEAELKGCRLLLKEPAELANGLPAYRAIFVWWPTDEVRLYQEQLYVLHEGTGFTLTASFTKKTRKTLGPHIERAMLTFTPGR